MKIIATNMKTRQQAIWENVTIEQIDSFVSNPNYISVLFRFPNYPTLAYESFDTREVNVIFDLT